MMPAWKGYYRGATPEPLGHLAPWIHMGGTDPIQAMYYKQTFLFLMMELFRYRYRQDLKRLGVKAWLYATARLRMFCISDFQ